MGYNIYKFNVNQIFRKDPTRTLTLRKKFSDDMKRRFNRLKTVIRKSIVDLDCFGLNVKFAVYMNPTQPLQFAFERDPNKVQDFMDWLRLQVDEGILQVYPGQQIGKAVETAWTNVYIQSAYQAGILRARNELLNAGYDVPAIGKNGVQAIFNQPFHVDRAGLVYTRTFEGLKGITGEMSNQISQVLAQGIAEGKGPLQLARVINDRVDKIGKTRATILARTEIIRAHHVATIQEYRNWGVVGVKVQAEWQTAEDSRVCSICSSLNGKIFDLNKIEGMIPKHPQCRCVALPVDITDQGE